MQAGRKAVVTGGMAWTVLLHACCTRLCVLKCSKLPMQILK